MLNNKTVRLNTVDAIKASPNIGSIKVYNTKTTPYMSATLPAVGVYLTNSSAQGRDHITPGFVRTLDINVEVVSMANSTTFMDTCDDLMFACKEALFGNTIWTGQFENIAGYTEQLRFDDTGEQPLAVATLVISCEVVEL